MTIYRAFFIILPTLATLNGSCSGSDDSGTQPGTGGTGTAGAGSAGKATAGTATAGASTSGTGGGGASSGGQIGQAGMTAGGSVATGGERAGDAGSSAGGNSAGMTADGGGKTTGGSSGSGAGGMTLGGSGSGGKATGGSSSGGKSGSGGTAGAPAGGLMPGNPPVRSAGCGKPATLTSGAKTLTVAGANRSYTIRIPANYDADKPYRLIFGMHWIGASMQPVDQGNGDVYPYYGLQRLDTQNSAIFIAPSAIDGRWNANSDLQFVDAMVDAAKQGLCIDTTRIFSTGFSYGAIFSYTLACARPNIFRAVAPIAAAPNLGCPNNDTPVAYLGITGMKDTLCTPALGRQCRNSFVERNGCTPPANVPEWSSGQNHVCYSYEGCGAYPVRWCTGNFEHKAAHCDTCGTGQDNRDQTWFDDEIWTFFTQF